jgi:hypothetical protein
VKYHDVNRAKLIQQIEEAKTVLEKLLALLQSVPLEPDRFVSHSINPGGSIGRTCENAGKSGKQIERSIISSFPSSREPWLQGRLSPMGALIAVVRIMVHFKTIQGQTERQRCWRSNLKRAGFDPNTEIIRHLFRFSFFGGMNNIGKLLYQM